MSERGRKEPVARKRQGIVPPRAPRKKAEACPECGGKGWKEYLHHPQDRFPDRDPCEYCHGTGRVEEVEDAG